MENSIWLHLENVFHIWQKFSICGCLGAACTSGYATQILTMSIRSLRALIAAFTAAAIFVAPCYGKPPASAPIELSVQVGGFLRSSYSVNLSGEVITCTASRAGKVINTVSGQPTTESWTKLRDTFDKLGVWNWQSSYVNINFLDGTQWSLNIKYADRSVTSEGSNSYPTEDGAPSAKAEQTAVFISFRNAVARLLAECTL